MNAGSNRFDTLSYEAIARALFENYESIYVVDMETSAYKCFHESNSYSSLQIENSGDDFFNEVAANILRTIYEEDQSFVMRMMSRDALIKALEARKYCSFVYRLMIGGKPLYHKFRATTDTVDGRLHLLIGIRNVDEAFRRDKRQTEELSSMHKKEINHLEAILSSADWYLEVNLTKDRILESSMLIRPESLPSDVRYPDDVSSLSYSEFEKWRVDNLIVEEKGKYLEISNREYLIKCFERGEKRASVSFSMRIAGGRIQPCKKVFYLYRDAPTDDILSFCVVYDLTEQQRRDKEIKDLELKLQMSRLRNFTSQMQPHFLYNALGSIQEIVLEDPAYASELIGDFTVHLRSCIRAMSNDAPIPFDQELKNIRAYVNIEKMRLGSKLRIEYDIQAKDFSIIPLSVQPIVENAIRHGIYERGAAGGLVTISTRELEDGILIAVEDDGIGFDVEGFKSKALSGDHDSTGLNNIKFRLDKVMNAKIDIKSRPGKGTRVTITLPKEKTEG